jgi:hypothetical protein
MSRRTRWRDQRYALFLPNSYLVVGASTWVGVFVGVWVYCIASYGFLPDVRLAHAGAVAASVLYWLWPVGVLGATWAVIHGFLAIGHGPSVS